MNRYRVKTEDGELRLYYPTLEDAQADYPDAEITLCEDLSHIKYIEQMFDDKYNKNCKALCAFNALGGCNR